MAGSPKNGRSVKVNRGPQNKLENDLKRVKGHARVMRQRHRKEQYDLTTRLRELCVTVMKLNDVNENAIDDFQAYDKYIPKIEQHQQTFVEYDENLTGKISWDEFQKAAEYLDIRGSHNQLKRSFDKFDTNRDQTIAEREFLQCLMPDLNVQDLLPLAQISTLRKHLSGLRSAHDRKQRAFDRLQDENEHLRQQLSKTKQELDKARMEPKNNTSEFLNWEPEDTGNAAYFEELEQKEREISDLRDQLRQAQKEIKRLQKFGTISRNLVNNLEATTSNKLLDATKMLMTATDATQQEHDLYKQQRKQVDMVSQLRQAFLEFDDNHSGEMSFKEFQDAYGRLDRKGKSQHELKRVFTRFDKDGSGYISEDEFMVAVAGDTFENVGITFYLNQLTDWIRRADALLAEERSLLASAKQERNHLLKNKVELTENLEEVRERNQDLLEQLATLEDELHRLRKELKDAREHNQSIINKLELELKDAKETILKHTERIRQLDRENELLTREIERLNEQHEENNRLLTKKFTEENQKLKDEIILTREEYDKLKDEILRLRAVAKRLRQEENYTEYTLSTMLREAIRKVLVVEGASKDDLETYDVDTKRIDMRNKLREAFVELDQDHTQEMSFEEFRSAWDWLDIKHDPKKLKGIFETIDRKGRGYVNEKEFLTSVMGDPNEEQNLPSGVEQACMVIQKLLEELSENEDDMLVLRQQIDELTRQITEMKDHEASHVRTINELEGKLHALQRKYEEAKMRVDDLKLELKARDTEYDELERRYQELEREYQRILKVHDTYKNRTVKNRLAEVTRRLANDISDNIRHLNDMMERETMKDQILVNQEHIISQLYKAFAQFDKNSDGNLDFDEFKDAWRYIGLASDDDEIKEVFDRFDADKDGLITDAEFIDAIMDERLMEMNMFLLFMKLARARDDLDNYVQVRKTDLIQARKDLEDTKKKWDIDNRSNARRRNGNFEWESKLKELCDDVVSQAASMESFGDRYSRTQSIDPITAAVQERRLQYNQIKEKFQKHDVEGNGCLTFEQFDKAWVELRLPGNQTQRQRQFTYIDEDASGYLSFREFVNACVGPDKGSDLGPFTELTVLRDYLNALQLQHHLSKGELDQYMKQLRELEKLRDQMKQSELARERLEKELEKLRDRCAHLTEVIEQMKNRIRELDDKYSRQLQLEKQMAEKQRTIQEKRLRESNFLCERLEEDNELLRKSLDNQAEHLEKLTQPLKEDNAKLAALIRELRLQVKNLTTEKESLEILLKSFSSLAKDQLAKDSIKV